MSSIALSGPLPYSAYHRAAHLGAGSFGSVVTVYNDDGEEYALKLFLDDDDNINDETTHRSKPVSLGAMREISCLRLLRGQHVNIINLIDIQPEWGEEEAGAGTAGCLGMALPLYRKGSLASSIDKKTFQAYPKKTKIEVAHGILSAVAFLHDNGILHRDIKSDNILLDDNDDSWKPVLIDFSLAKPINNSLWCSTTDITSKKTIQSYHEPVEHTGEVGTVVYTAPEIINNELYGEPADVFSVGVVLLELLQSKTFTAMKHKEAETQINEALQQLPVNAPFASLVRSMLSIDPSRRPTARQCLENPLFEEKFGLPVPAAKRINVGHILPYDFEDVSLENDSPNIQGGKSRKQRQDPKMQKRMNLIEKLCNELDSTHPMTKHAAFEYSLLLDELDENLNNLDMSQGLVDCVVLAHRFFELNLLDLDDLDEQNNGRFEAWNLQDYIDNESTIFMMTDYCLYPRTLHWK